MTKNSGSQVRGPRVGSEVTYIGIIPGIRYKAKIIKVHSGGSLDLRFTMYDAASEKNVTVNVCRVPPAVDLHRPQANSFVRQ